MHRLFIDIETFSSADISETGSWRYFEAPDFEILLAAYSLDDGPVEVVDLAQGETLPAWFVPALRSSEYLKYAFNASFEYGAFCRVYGPMIPSQWRDTMMHGMYASLPASLKAMGAALGLPEDKQKLTTGAALIRFFCSPVKPTRANGQRTRNLPKHDPDKWRLFKEYNRQDVAAEMEIERRLKDVVVPDWLQKQWETDLRINQRGVAVDMELTAGALAIRDSLAAELSDEAAGITGLGNANSQVQLVGWIRQRLGRDIRDCTKATVTALLKEDLPDDVRRMLEIRQELGKTSTKKYDAIQACVCEDGRVRGLIQFYGASRTGRYAGRLLQLQNLPRTYIRTQDLARKIVKARDAEVLQMIYGAPFDTLAQLIRTALTATPGNVLIDADFSAIEARVIAWLADERWALEVFRGNGKIYEATAAQMFGVPVEKIKKGNPEYALRAKGKVATLALGYQGGVSALVAMGALEQGLSEEELPEIVDKWRKANPHIKQLWNAFNQMAIDAIDTGRVGRHYIGNESCVSIYRNYITSAHMSALVMELPSGRKLYYLDPALGTNRFGDTSISYLGSNQTTKKWERIETYGGRLVENSVQAIARDLLAEAIERLEAAGYPIVFHVHDEVVIDIRPYAGDEQMLADVVRIMAENPRWCPSLPLSAAGWVGSYFTKD